MRQFISSDKLLNPADTKRESPESAQSKPVEEYLTEDKAGGQRKTTILFKNEDVNDEDIQFNSH